MIVPGDLRIDLVLTNGELIWGLHQNEAVEIVFDSNHLTFLRKVEPLLCVSWLGFLPCIPDCFFAVLNVVTCWYRSYDSHAILKFTLVFLGRFYSYGIENVVWLEPRHFWQCHFSWDITDVPYLYLHLYSSWFLFFKFFLITVVFGPTFAHLN